MKKDPARKRHSFFHVRKVFLINLTVCLASILLLVLGTEIFIRAARGDLLNARHKYPQGLYCKNHPVFGWLGEPFATGKVSFASQDMETMDISMNHEGFWDTRHEIKKPPGKKRILFLGDSFTIGYGIQKKDRFSDVIAKQAPEHVEIMNMGMWGYSMDQELLVLTDLGLQYNPDVVVASIFLDDFFCANLFSVNEGRYIKPKFSIAPDGALHLGNVPVPDNSGKSMVRNFLVTRINLLRNRLSVGQDFTNKDWFSIFDKAYMQEAGYQLPLRILDEIFSISKKNDIRFLLVIIPYKDQLMKDTILADGNGYVGIPPERLAMELPQRLVTFYSEKANIPVLDLLPLFKKHALAEKLFFERDLHWTKKGHALAAQAIYDRLTSMGCL
jgi:hypothetical protein